MSLASGGTETRSDDTFVLRWWNWDEDLMLVITEVCVAGDGTDEMVFLCLLDQMQD